MVGLKVGVNDVIRAYDFKPMVGRNDCYVEGKVLDRNDNTNGFQAYKIRVTKDVFDGKEFNERGYGSRVGEIVFVPWRVDFMEYQGRVMNLSE